MAKSSQKKHAVLLGGAGFIGSELINALSKDNWRLTVVTKRPHRHRNLLVVPALKMLEAGDLSSEALTNMISESDTVVNLIGILNQSRGASFAEVHGALPERIANACLKGNARRLIHVSALGADASGPSEYLKSRAQGERAVLSAMDEGLDSIIIRPSIVFGPGDSSSRLFQQMLSMAPLLFPLVVPNASVQPVYVGDVVRCIKHAIVAEVPELGSFDIAGPKTYTLREFVSLIDQFSGMHHRIIGLGPFVSKVMASFAQFAPGKPLTPDNLLSLQAPATVRNNMPAPYGIQSTRFESVAPAWLGPRFTEFDSFRTQAGR